MPRLKRTLTTFVVCFVVCFVGTLFLRLGRSHTSVDYPDRPGTLSSGGERNGWKAALDSLQTEPGHLLAEPVIERNPRRIRARDPKLKKEFDYLIYDLGKDIELRLIKVAAKGKSFVIGSPKNEKGRANIVNGVDSEEQHGITFSNDYYIGVFEVTRRQFRRFAEETGYKTDAERQHNEYRWNEPGFPQTDSHPVDWISWNDAKRFCEWLSKKGSNQFAIRLPGEAEWEFACRAGSKSKYHFGDNSQTLPQYDNVADATLNRAKQTEYGVKGSDGFVDTSPVGTFRPNAFGLYDMHGNLSEWCEDTSGMHSDLPVTDNSIQTKPSEDRVKKGGAYDFPAFRCRSAARDELPANFVGGSTGFRVAVVIKNE